jgi:signal peptidase II
VTDDSRPAVVGGGGLPAEAPTASSDPRDGPAAGATMAAAVAHHARRRWGLFTILAVAVVATDQVAKAVVTRSLAPGQSVDVVGDLVRIVFGQNSGALFGLFKDNAAMFGVVSIVVVGLIVAYHARSAASLYLTVTLGFLLGGAIGNMLDRLRLGYVVDFVDVGIGPTRFYTFNVADSAISLAILLLFVAALRPSLVETGSRTTESQAPAAPTAPTAPAAPVPSTTGDDWGDGLEPDDRPPVGDPPP